jgi:Icc protein
MQSIRLLQFTDPHLSADAAATFRGVDTLQALRTAVVHAAQRFSRPDAYLLTGDLVQDDPEGYRWVRHVFSALQAPVLCLAGNHDVPDRMRSELSAEPFQVGGQRSFGRWVIVLLDTWVAGDAGGRLGPDQLQQLRATLELHRNDHVLLCLHHHPIRMRSDWLDTVGLRDADEFMALIRGHANVRGVLWGHVHQALDSFVDGIRFMSTPATCAQFLPASKDFALDQRPPGYRALELMPDGSIATEVVWLESYQKRSSNVA